MREGQVSRSYFCPECGAPAHGARASRLGEPFRGYWAPSCTHAVRVERMGPKRRAAVLERWERREQVRREWIASCTGEPLIQPDIEEAAT